MFKPIVLIVVSILLCQLANAQEVYLLDALPTTTPPEIWPKDVPFPDGLKTYKKAVFTQSISTFNNRPSIERVHRTWLLPKWQMSGGVEGIKNFKSDMYVLGDQKYHEYISYIQVLNSLGYFQPELGYKREFANGNLFVDCLSSEGKVFELRVAEKQKGQWRRYVAFKDESSRPLGYTGLKVSCQSCHSQAGSGGYNEGLIPGGDTVISFPLYHLEK